MKPEFTIATIAHNSEQYRQMLQLRLNVLLQPIGVDASYIQPEQEKEDTLIGAFKNEQLIGCCILTRLAEATVQLRQMAVQTGYQGKGFGAALLFFAEAVAKDCGYETVRLHARAPVVPFYEKQGYVICSELFEEVGIEHYRMEKRL